ncbi:MAG: FAD-dependent oxidoreductase [Pleurocapsa sp. SU_196_0]|nr:FAD-dependent oxidoreductase [Pleurocapsa sp. SU_196_0]
MTIREARGDRLSRVEGALAGNRQGHVVIVGGGITGLSAAHALRLRARVTLLESDGRLGGEARHGAARVSTWGLVSWMVARRVSSRVNPRRTVWRSSWGWKRSCSIRARRRGVSLA